MTKRKIKDLVKQILIPSAIVLGIIVIVSVLAFSGSGPKQDNKGNNQEIANKVLAYVNNTLLRGQSTASIVETNEESNLVKLKIKIGTSELETYATKDGKLFFPQAFKLEEQKLSQTDQNASAGASAAQSAKTCEDLKKVEEPILNAFVVSKCPFGLQMQRMLAEMAKSAPSLMENVKVRYIGSVVNNKITAMHGDEEAQENLRQICIREETNKYWDYISCHIKKGEVESCLKTANVDQDKLTQCMSDPKKGLKYAQEDFDIQDKFDIRGSPSLILNDEETSESYFGGRTAEAAKSLVCCSFQNKPSACSQKLNENQAATGFSENYSKTTSGTPSATPASAGGCAL